MPAVGVSASQVQIKMKQFQHGDDDDADARNNASNSKRICISWKNVHVTEVFTFGKKMKDVFLKSCTKVKRKTILNGINGIVKPGQLMALMGTSGSGKSTLLNVINFKSKGNLSVKGEIFINGIKADAVKMGQVSCFVRQDDLFFPKLTVEEHLMIQAILRLSKEVSADEKTRKVKLALKDFQLEVCKKAYVRDISGGQKRRLAFATENLTDPQVLFCDEPTSGLDSHIAKSLIQYLKELTTASGKTIICTIHQPSNEIFAMFDSICLLSNGNQAFFGPLEDAYKFFTRDLKLVKPPNASRADFYLDCLGLDPNDPDSEPRVKARCDVYQASAYNKDVCQAIENQPVGRADEIFPRKATTYKAGLFDQLKQLTARCFKSYFREPKVVLTDLLMAIVTGLLGGAIYIKTSQVVDGECIFDNGDIQNVSTALFYSIMTITIVSTLGAVLAFPNEIPIIMREGEVYRVEMYYLAKFFSEIPVYIVIPTLHSFIIYYMVVFGCTTKNLLLFWYTIVLISNAAYSLGHILSALGGTVNMSISLAAPVLAVEILFSGFFLKEVKNLPGVLNAVKYVSLFNYGYDLLMVNQWEIIGNLTCSAPIPELCIPDGPAVLADFEIDKGDKIFFIAMLTVMIVVLRLLTYLVLKFKLEKHKIKSCIKRDESSDYRA